MTNYNIIKNEISKFWQGDIEDSDESLTHYSHDASLFEVRPGLVVFPKDANDICNLVKWVSENKSKYPELSITPRSAGTCMAGGPLGESIILDVTRYMGSIISYSHVDPYVIKPFYPNSTQVKITGEATVLPGYFYRDLEKILEKENLLLPCFTASKSINTIGGMVGNNSGGELSLRYGKTEDYVSSLKVVLSDGYEYKILPITRRELYAKINQNTFEGNFYSKIFNLVRDNDILIRSAKPRVSKNSAGYNIWNVWKFVDKGQESLDDIFDVCQLIVGSQGTLGIVTEIKLKLITPKKEQGLCVVYLNSLENIGNLVNIIQEVIPDTIEAYDDKTIKLAIKFWSGFIKKRGLWGAIKLGISFLGELRYFVFGFPKLVLLISLGGNDIFEIKNTLSTLSDTLKKNKTVISTSIVMDKTDQEKFWTIRHDSFALLREHFQDFRTAPFIDDVIVPPESLPEFFPKITKLLDEYGLIYNMHGHAGNGNFHIIPLMDLKSPVSSEQILEISDKVYDMVISFGGSIDAEHNDGIIRTPYLAKMFGPEVTLLFKNIKDIFDNKNIFNPGKKVGGTKDDILKFLPTNIA